MEAHAHDLRSEVDDEAWVELIKSDWRSAVLTTKDRAILEFAEKLTLTPQQMGQADVDFLKAEGLDDRAVHDLSQVISYFNYINRIADSLGTDPEEFFAPPS